ncbi:Endoplasmic reticulum protein Pkr1 [Penicillium riverlandense]|uniref:Endoplasmic reticulum protein Pkr1 n=1 Tax=Penicillium riverlandense TaxID=1903569 RepID=UPI002546D74C|nr:Endoplasmic reticulum protein Pkr1 [Penicillium riverlandense]KAJ5815393.1 Endoplasmic reticulum protein Pkr1 [Penicillium riverlandense]
MASFMQDLWSSVFTPGPTPTLLVATNVSFAALQVVLLALLVATSSIHFVVLSAISAGLWWAINWFAAEVRAVQLAQQKETADAPGDNPDSETETESVAAGRKPKSATASATGSKVAAADLPLPTERDGRKRPGTPGDGSEYASTDSEWEKVDNQAS